MVISIPMTPEFRKTWLWGRDWVEDPDKTSNFWHAVCVVGYDDTRASYSPGAADDRYKGRLIVQNSWDTRGDLQKVVSTAACSTCRTSSYVSTS